MSKCTEIREICGDYAFDVEYSKDFSFTMFFNSLRNAQTVKRCIEVDDSVPNVATAVDFVEVVRCKDCKYYKTSPLLYPKTKRKFCYKVLKSNGIAVGHGFSEDDFCSYGERKEHK